MLYIRKCDKLEQQASDNSKQAAKYANVAAIKEADTIFREAEEKYKRTLPDCEQELKQAERGIQSAEAALQWLKAQA